MKTGKDWYMKPQWPARVMRRVQIQGYVRFPAAKTLLSFPLGAPVQLSLASD
jgi:hypothetical protein